MSERGFTILEIMVASVIAGTVAAGTLMSFVAAGQMIAVQKNLSVAEATTYSQDSMEHFRNHIACQPPWFDVNCNYIGPAGWVADSLPPTPSGGSESILSTTARRCYRVTPSNCGSGPNSCFAVEVRVCWNNDLVNCPC
ncbi:MAG: type II secretion system protein [Candidatus Omnitrophica bacterium]|nr:type II secretion system protein [Candidatus Omnitrophota bacterium]